jgi:tRNA1(Val) A37 N6-methylase TrmN6
LLADPGSLWVILPVKESLQFIDIAENSGFYVHYILKVFPKAGKECNRLILQLKREETADIRIESLTHWEAEGQWSEEFKRFTGEFYVDF